MVLIKTIYKLIKLVFFRLPTIIMIAKIIWKYLYKVFLVIWVAVLIMLKKRK